MSGRWLRPELIQPKIELVEAAIVDGVDASRALCGHRYEVAIEQRLEVLGDRRPADRKAFRKLVYGARRASQFLQQEAPVRVGNRRKWVHVRHAEKLRQMVSTGKRIVHCGEGWNA